MLGAPRATHHRLSAMTTDVPWSGAGDSLILIENHCFTSANLLNVFIYRRQLNPSTCFCIQSAVIMLFGLKCVLKLTAVHTHAVGEGRCILIAFKRTVCSLLWCYPETQCVAVSSSLVVTWSLLCSWLFLLCYIQTHPFILAFGWFLSCTWDFRNITHNFFGKVLHGSCQVWRISL